jgi:hypothetical protein
MKDDIEKIVRSTAKACARIAKRKTSEMALPSDWAVDVTINWNGYRCWGGVYSSHWRDEPVKPRISIAPGRYTPSACRVTLGWGFTEYARIADDPTIGSFVAAADEWAPLKAAIAHETAHAIQYTIGRKVRRQAMHPRLNFDVPAWQERLDWKTPHGDGWRAAYAMLRRELGLTRKSLGG